MAITKASGQAVAPAAKGDLVVGSATNDAAVLGVGSADQVLTVDSSTTTGLKWATPATVTTWTQRLTPQTEDFKIVKHNGSNLYVAAGNNGQMFTSPDGITWTSRTSGFGANSITALAYGNGLWVAGGDNGTITTSSDGITWTARTANMGTNQILSVIYANSLWVAVGNGGGTINTGGITYSSDGITWTRKSQSLTVGQSYNDVTYNGTNWVVGASVNTNNYLYASTPSGTWTVGHTGTSGEIYRIFWDGTRHITVEGANRSWYYSTSTTLGTTTRSDGLNKINIGSGNTGSMFYYNSKIYLTNSVYWATVTPASSTSWAMTTPQMPPAVMTTTSPYLQHNVSVGIFVNSSGIVYAGASGIWTSF